MFCYVGKHVLLELAYRNYRILQKQALKIISKSRSFAKGLLHQLEEDADNSMLIVL